MSENGEQPIENPAITVEFMPDGNTRLHTTAHIGPNQLWVAARLMELMGDSQFAEAQLLAQAKNKNIVLPGLRGLTGGKK